MKIYWEKFFFRNIIFKENLNLVENSTKNIEVYLEAIKKEGFLQLE